MMLEDFKIVKNPQKNEIRYIGQKQLPIILIIFISHLPLHPPLDLHGRSRSSNKSSSKQMH